MFHANNGLYFERDPDGSVVVSHWLHGTAHPVLAAPASVEVLDRRWTLTAAEWASVVATVSAQGESGETHGQALAFHEGTMTL